VAFSFFYPIIETPYTKEKTMSSTTISRGNVLSQTYIGPSLTPVAVAAYTTATQTFKIAGLQTTDIVQYVGLQGAQTAGVTGAECDVLTAGVLTVAFINSTAASVTPAAGVYVFSVTQVENLPLPVTAV
jgi:hypothetical protein